MCVEWLRVRTLPLQWAMQPCRWLSSPRSGPSNRLNGVPRNPGPRRCRLGSLVLFSAALVYPLGTWTLADVLLLSAIQNPQTWLCGQPIATMGTALRCSTSLSLLNEVSLGSSRKGHRCNALQPICNCLLHTGSLSRAASKIHLRRAQVQGGPTCLSFSLPLNMVFNAYLDAPPDFGTRRAKFRPTSESGRRGSSSRRPPCRRR